MSQRADDRSLWVSSARHPYLAIRQRDPKSQSAATASAVSRRGSEGAAFASPLLRPSPQPLY